METVAKIVGGIVLAIGGLIVVSFLLAYPTKWIINWLFTPGVLTSLFGVAKISVTQAWALNAICGTLFKGAGSSSK